MKHHYEILLALIVSSKEEEIKELLERLEQIMNAEGATVEQKQRLERKEFAYEHCHQKSAYYVNFVVNTEPASIEKIRQKLALVGEVTLQNYLRKEGAHVANKVKKATRAAKEAALA
ncbi:MAG: 30S ribosomal protein S6 [Chthoniobacterales bacterium]